MDLTYLEPDYLKMQNLLTMSNFDGFKKQHLSGTNLLAINRRLKMNVLHYFSYIIKEVDFEKFPPYEFIRYLIDNGIDINSEDVDGLTAMHYSIGNTRKHLELCNSLIKLGANVDIRSKRGHTPLWAAIIEFRGEEMLRLLIITLIKSGASIDKENKAGISPRTHVETIKKSILQGGNSVERDISFILDI